MKRSPLKRKSFKKKKKEGWTGTFNQVPPIDKKGSLMAFFFLEIWEERKGDRYCYETGKKLYGDPSSTMFHHILEKSKYPQFKFEKWNIVLLTPEVHEQVHLNIDKTPRVKALKEYLLNQLDNE